MKNKKQLTRGGSYTSNSDMWVPKKKIENKKQETRGGSSTRNSDKQEEDPKEAFNDIVKEIQFLGSTHMTWKEKKEQESRKVVSLGGKPVKKQRLPLSVARVVMKKQKDREEKIKAESIQLGRFGGIHSRDSGKAVERRRPEKRVLKSSEGHFRNGVLDVNHLLQPSAPKVGDDSKHATNKGKKKKGGKKNRGKKGTGRKRR